MAGAVYSDDPEVHAAITRSASSHARTIRNLKRLVDGGIVTRAAVIEIDQQPAEIERTTRYLTDLGVRHVRHSRVRAFGRGEEVLSQRTQMSELCGHCWSGRLCVAPDGDVYPCVMARRWPVGNVRTAPLADIVHSPALAGVRATIHDTVWVPKLAAGGPPDGHAAEGPPDESPQRPYPGEGEPAPAECPQSCVPDTVTPKCPQSCDPFIVVCEPTEPTPQEEPGAPGYAEPGGVIICVPLGDTTQPEEDDGG